MKWLVSTRLCLYPLCFVSSLFFCVLVSPPLLSSFPVSSPCSLSPLLITSPVLLCLCFLLNYLLFFSLLVFFSSSSHVCIHTKCPVILLFTFSAAKKKTAAHILSPSFQAQLTKYEPNNNTSLNSTWQNFIGGQVHWPCTWGVDRASCTGWNKLPLVSIRCPDLRRRLAGTRGVSSALTSGPLGVQVQSPDASTSLQRHHRGLIHQYTLLVEFICSYDMHVSCAPGRWIVCAAKQTCNSLSLNMILWTGS